MVSEIYLTRLLATKVTPLILAVNFKLNLTWCIYIWKFSKESVYKLLYHAVGISSEVVQPQNIAWEINL